MRRIHHAAVVAATLAIGFARPAPGDDFRIETKVYAGKGKEPASRNTTLFRAGFVYDYLSDDGQVVVFDPEDPSKEIERLAPGRGGPSGGAGSGFPG